MQARREIGKAGWGWTALAAVISLIYFFPAFWIILTAFKSRGDTLAVPPVLFFQPIWDNFVSVFYRASITAQASQETQFLRYFVNSMFISGTSVLLALIIGCLAAYGFSRFPLKGNDTYLFIILTTRMMPAIVVIIPIFLMFRLTGLAGTYAGIILLYTAFNIPFSVWMIKSFFDELNREVEDAARMDGSSEILTWNEFLFALLLTGVETRTVPVAMARTLGGEIGVDYGLLAAIVTLFLIPIIVVTFLLQNQLLRGVTFGTVRR